MTRQNRLLALLAAVGFFGACSDDGVSPGSLFKLFGATMSPANEVPAVTATSSGSADLTVIDTNTIRVETRVTAIDSVTQAHIHAGVPTVAGPIMIFLAGTYPAAQGGVAKAPNGSITMNGTLSHLDIIRGAAVFQGVFTFDSLLFRVNNGTAYVNVHTKKNPGGEIRGTVLPK